MNNEERALIEYENALDKVRGFFKGKIVKETRSAEIPTGDPLAIEK
jgi:hypothetical protein